ncbi:hypothetical protein HYS30_01270 [Candidatus Peregrinibacteria bacterium]|nr:hypothetical protein [Candidatus Peregrinibacteria bacterium]
MSSHRKILALSLFSLLLLGGCRSSPKEKKGEQALRNARDAIVYIIVVARARASLPRTSQPGASLGIHLSTYISKSDPPVHGALESTRILGPLVRTSDATEAPFITIQTLGNLVQMNIVEAMNKNPERGDVLNRYIILLRSTLQNAQRDQGNLRDRRQQLIKEERERQSVIRALQKETDTAERAGDFSTMVSRQRPLSDAKGEQGKTEASIDELDNTLEILSDLTRIAEERLNAIEENREALMAGIRIVEIPGIEKLGILEKMGTSKRRSRRQEHGGGLLDFSDI